MFYKIFHSLQQKYLQIYYLSTTVVVGIMVLSYIFFINFTVSTVCQLKRVTDANGSNMISIANCNKGFSPIESVRMTPKNLFIGRLKDSNW